MRNHARAVIGKCAGNSAGAASTLVPRARPATPSRIAPSRRRSRSTARTAQASSTRAGPSMRLRATLTIIPAPNSVPAQRRRSWISRGGNHQRASSTASTSQANTLTSA